MHPARTLLHRRRHPKLLAASLAIATTLAIAVVGCGDSACAESETCAASPDGALGDGGKDGGPDGPSLPDGCDLNVDVKDSLSCVHNDVGVFVDGASGADTNLGTKESPLKTIAAALGKLGSKPRLYLCGAGPYAESVKLTSAVSLYGGFACGTWSHDGVKAKLAPAEAGYALHIDNVASPIVVSDFDIAVGDASAPGGSSVAVFASRAAKVTLRRTSVAAGKGQAGADATDLADFSPANAPDGTSGGAGGAETPNPACTTSVGGAGGNGNSADGKAGKEAVNPPFPETPLSNGAGGASSAHDCNGGSSGRNGSYGLAGEPGAGAATAGTLEASGWKAAEGRAGGAGGNGQGGGGGAKIADGGVGGSGGPGGCGGAGGGKGAGGGSSIAVLAFESALVFEQSLLSANDAGRGGNGAKGQKAQLASASGGAPSDANDACGGGIGGAGGSGGGGGGGAGGLSAGIVYKGTPPTVDGTSTSSADTLSGVTLGAKGAAGTGGAGGEPARPNSRAGESGKLGADGAAKAVISAP
jgi:hypothetical protein